MSSIVPLNEKETAVAVAEAKRLIQANAVDIVQIDHEFFLRIRIPNSETGIDTLLLLPGAPLGAKLPLVDFVELFRENLRAILDCVRASIYITDNKANILLINKEAEKTGERGYDAIVGMNMADLLAEGYCTTSTSIEVIKTGKELTITQPDEVGDPELLLTGVPCVRNETLELVITVERDLKEIAELRRKLEHTEEKMQMYEGELEFLRQQELRPTDVICESKAMKNIVATAVRMAQNDATVLIQGESGSGKEVIADILYKYSNRVGKPFIKINCSAIPETLLESELFGYEKGAFTGAGTKGKMGLFELADKGTLFLDEISELSTKLQPKLLRVLQQGELIRVGGERVIHVDVRVIAASNVDLLESIEKGIFRKDLYYRLNVVPIRIPPLRERPEDILPLALHFMKKFNEKYSCNKKLDFESSMFLTEYSWPGNVRELENIIERAIITSENESMTSAQILRCLKGENAYIHEIDKELTLPEMTAAFEKRILEDLYAQCRSVTAVGRQLGISKSAVCKKMQKYGIPSKEGAKQG